MIKFVKTRDLNNPDDKMELEMRLDSELLNNNEDDLEILLYEFENFLRAIGYYFDGEVTIFNDKEFFKDEAEFRAEIVKT